MPKAPKTTIENIVLGKKMNKEVESTLTAVLKERFEKNMHRHKGITWADVEKKLLGNKKVLLSLKLMEDTLGEPDVIRYDKKNNQYVFCDCSAETPKGGRSICYDKAAQELREKKGVHPAGNALNLAKEMDIEILNIEEYGALQELEAFDQKTSSWLKTPNNIRNLGGAIFGDRRFDTVFTYHNGADPHYSARGFRGKVCV